MPEPLFTERSSSVVTTQPSPLLPDAQTRYAHVVTLFDFEDSINCLQFDPTTELLAVGCDDGRFRVFQVGGNFTRVVKFRIPDVAVTSILWHPTEAGLIYIGYSDGGIVECRLDRAAPEGIADFKPVTLGLRGPVEALDFSSHTSSIAAVVGPHVALAEWAEHDGLWASCILPSPPCDNVIPNQEGILPCSLHLCEQGRTLVVSYLYHGIVGWDISSGACLWRIQPGTRIARSALSPDERTIVICNLLDGFTQYSIATCKEVRRYAQDVVENVPLPALFIHGGHSILCGSDHGEVPIFDADSGAVLDILRHPAREIVQAIAHRQARNSDWIATGTSEKGRETTVIIWRRACSTHTERITQPGNKHSTPSLATAVCSAQPSALPTSSAVSTTRDAISADIRPAPRASQECPPLARLRTVRQRDSTPSASAQGNARTPESSPDWVSAQMKWTVLFVLAPIVMVSLTVFARRNEPGYGSDTPDNSLQLHSVTLRRVVLKVAAAFARYFPGVTDFLKEFVYLVEAHARGE